MGIAIDMNARVLPTRPSRKFARSPSFTLGNRALRLAWICAWILLARWTPRWLNPWRVLLLNLFGAKVSRQATIYASARVWLPAHLQIGPLSILGPGVECYNMAPISIGARTVVSQRAFLCAGTHDFRDPAFQLVARPIRIGDDAWIAAEAFVGPGVTVASGCVLGARACAFEDLEAWTVYRGNPAAALMRRTWRTPAPPADRAS